jgi:hypothetical protein
MSCGESKVGATQYTPGADLTSSRLVLPVRGRCAKSELKERRAKVIAIDELANENEIQDLHKPASI